MGRNATNLGAGSGAEGSRERVDTLRDDAETGGGWPLLAVKKFKKTFEGGTGILVFGLDGSKM